MTQLLTVLLITALNGTWNLELYGMELVIFDNGIKSQALLTVKTPRHPVRLVMEGKVEERNGKHSISFETAWSEIDKKCSERVGLFLEGKLSEDGFSDTYEAKGAVLFVVKCNGIVSTEPKMIEGVWRRKKNKK